MIRFLDRLLDRPRGTLRLEIYRCGILVERFDGRNLIVNGAAPVLANLLGGSVANQSVTQIGFGTNGTPPAAGNTGLTNIYLKPVDSVSYPTNGTVSFAFSLASGEANGMAISEFGLFTQGGTLFSRRVRASPINKDTDISISATWSISF